MSHIQQYLDDTQSVGRHLSEQHMCNRFADRILSGLLGYAQEDWIINPSAGDDEGAEGIPDISVLAHQNGEQFRWIEIEAKLTDEQVRNDDKRQQLWEDKRKYVRSDTVHFVWISRHTILVCGPDGELKRGVYLDVEQKPLFSGDARIIHSTDDREVRETLDMISAEAANNLRFLEYFRAGELPSRYLEVTHDTADKLTDALRRIISSLRAHFADSWHALRDGYTEYLGKSAELEEYIEDRGGLLNERQRSLRRERLRREYRQAAQLFEYAFPEFCEQQAYTHWEPESSTQSEEEALADIFRTNAAYVALGRLLFVRFAEDQTDVDGEPLISRKISNGGVSTWLKLVGKQRPHIGQLVNLAFTQAGSIFEQVFSRTPFDEVIRLDDADFDLVLLRVLYELNAYDFATLDRDVLGDLYQKLLPRDLRKKMGEFYTDQEVVEYILHRSGYVEACRTHAPTILDPACGSGTFLVRAAVYLIEGARQRGVDDANILNLVSRSIHGLDINDFAVFIARVNLLFTVFDLIAKTRTDVVFNVHEANSLMGPEEVEQFASAQDGGIAIPAITEGERVRLGRYDFVVGNPPYVRAERIPDQDRASIQRIYSRVAEHNVDLAGYFVYRSIQWLAEDGTFSMIVPRAITDAGFSAKLRVELAASDITVTELTPLDWACHELFDSDTVPVIIEYGRRDRRQAHDVALVHGLRSRDDISRAGEEPVPVASLPWCRFVGERPADTWPLEATLADLDVRDWLSKHQPLETHAVARFGVKLGARCSASDRQRESCAPVLTGADVFPFFHESSRRFATVADAADQSLWRDATWNHLMQRFHWAQFEARETYLATACAKINITINAALIDATRVACQDTTLLVQWKDERHPAGALTTLLNSALMRWYAFVFLRAGVAGGGRRDYTIYPRTLTALPCPNFDIADASLLHELAQTAADVAQLAAPLDLDIWGQLLEETRPDTPLSQWPVIWNGWPEDIGLSSQTLCVERLDQWRLQLTKSIKIASETNPDVLDFLAVYLPAVAESVSGRRTRNEVQALLVPDRAQILGLLRRYADALEARDMARAKYLDLCQQIDEAVFDAFEMPDALRQIVRRRMSEFPLSENANRPRLPWEPTRKPKIKIFEPGNRYH
jgi:hypothetical protein